MFKIKKSSSHKIKIISLLTRSELPDINCHCGAMFNIPAHDVQETPSELGFFFGRPSWLLEIHILHFVLWFWMRVRFFPSSLSLF